MYRENTSFSESITSVKNDLIDQTYIASMLLMIPVLISMYFGREDGNLIVTAGLAMLLFVALLLIYLNRKSIPYKYRASFLTIAAFAMGINSFLRWGIISGGPMLFMLGTILLALHIPPKATKIVFSLSIVAIVGAGFLVVHDFLQITLDLNKMLRTGNVWFVLITLYTLVGSITLRNIKVLNSYMGSFIEQLETQNHTITHMAYYDQLTGLPNRELFRTKVLEAILKSEASGTPFLLAYIDMDDFKKINNLLGHKIGDQILRSVTKRLQLKLNDNAFLARMGGDEFAILFTGTECAMATETINTIIQSVFNQTFKANDAIYHIGCSTGFTCYPLDGNSYELLLKNADTALFDAKSKGKNCFTIYSQQMRQDTDDKIAMEGALEVALEAGELFAYYQPKVHATTGAIKGFEALARWDSPKYGFVSPGEFIPLLEETGLIVPFGRHIMFSALLDLKKWLEAGNVDLTMAVNVSAVQFTQPDFAESIFKILDELQLPPQVLEIEITESILINGLESVAKTITTLHDKGISIALDDFGTGYSSLNYLRNLPISTLKIDQSFISNLEDNTKEEVLLPTIIQLAHKLDLDVVAEGIETKEHVAFLQSNDCDTLQGYYFSKPVPAEQIPGILLQNLIGGSNQA